MRILLTNDDGIEAPGLAALERLAGVLSDDVWVVAPELEMSGASRALTLTQPLRARRLGERRFAVDGTPTDCVLLGVQELVAGARPDLVLSGVNRGQNLCEDVTLSGTVAGAIEGMALGIPAIALSQSLRIFHDEIRADFEPAVRHGPGIITRLLAVGWPRDVVINLNFPPVEADSVQGLEVTRQGVRDQVMRHAEKRTDLRGRDYYWLGFKAQPSKPSEGTDLRAIQEGRISITPLHIDLTHHRSAETLKAAFEDFAVGSGPGQGVGS